MNRKYNGGGCGCGGTPLIPQNGGQNNDENSNNGNSNNGVMGFVKGLFGGQNAKKQLNTSSNMEMRPSRRMKEAKSSRVNGNGNGNMEVSPNSSNEKRPSRRMKEAKSSRVNENGDGNMEVSTNSSMEKRPSRRMKQAKSRRVNMNSTNTSTNSSIPAKEIKFSNGSNLEQQVTTMESKLNSIAGKGGMYGGQNNSLAALHDKVNDLSRNVEVIKNHEESPVNNLFGGEYPMANVFIDKQKNGGGIFEDIGSAVFGNSSTTTPTPIEPINSSVTEAEVQETSSLKNSSLPDPSSVVNRSSLGDVTQSEPTVSEPTGGKFINSLFGGYKLTKRDRKYLKRFKQGKSIGFTMRSSLKAKGLIPRSNGTRRVSKKYRG